MVNSDEWWLLKDSKKVGPMTLDALRLALQGADAYVWRNGMSEWQLSSTLPDLNLVGSGPEKKGASEARKASLGLILGIIFFPFIFSWFTLRAGYSIFFRFVSIAYMIAIVAGLSLREEGRHGLSSAVPQVASKSDSIVVNKNRAATNFLSAMQEFGATDGMPLVRNPPFESDHRMYGVQAGNLKSVIEESGGRVLQVDMAGFTYGVHLDESTLGVPFSELRHQWQICVVGTLEYVGQPASFGGSGAPVLIFKAVYLGSESARPESCFGRPAPPRDFPIASEWIGKHPSLLVESNFFSRFVKDNFTDLSSKIEVAGDLSNDGGVVWASGCRAHLCGECEAAIGFSGESSDFFILDFCDKEINFMIGADGGFNSIISQSRNSGAFNDEWIVKLPVVAQQWARDRVQLLEPLDDQM